MGSVLWDIFSGIRTVLRSFRGALMVQPMSRGFWDGKQFRAYVEFTLADGQSTVVRFAAGAPFLLEGQTLHVVEGEVRVDVVVGGTPDGVWTALPTVNPKYRIGMEPISSIALATGGTIAGGTVREVLLGAAGTGGSVKSHLTGSEISAVRGLPAGTYYQKITAVGGAARGIFVLEWEDLDE